MAVLESPSTVEELLEIRQVREWTASGVARVVREAGGYSLEDIAGLVGVSRSTVLRWERGDFRPSPRKGLTYGRLLRDLMRPPQMTTPSNLPGAGAVGNNANGKCKRAAGR